MMVKSGIEKTFSKFLHAESIFFLIHFEEGGGKSELFFCDMYLTYLIDLVEQNFCRDSNMMVKLMYESVK